MKIVDTEPGISTGNLQRLATVVGNLVEVAFVQANAFAVVQIDGRNNFQFFNSRKFRNKRAPSAEERSGWNCAATKLPRPIIAENKSV